MRPDTLVIINQSTGDLTIDVCNAFVGMYKNIYLITGDIRYGLIPLDSTIKTIKIISYNKTSIVKRLKTWIVGTFQIYNVLSKIKVPKDIFFFTGPPMSYIFADKQKNRFSIAVYDVYPDALRNVRCPSFIINSWIKRNKQVFAKSNQLITLSDGMRKQLCQYCDSEKIKVVPVWSTVGTPNIVPNNKNPFIKSLGLEDKFIILYSGNIGYTHNVETIVEVANELKKDDNIHFLIIGEGGKKSSLIEKAQKLNLNNVTFHDFLPIEELKYSLSCASLGVVTLTAATANASVPSKTFNNLAYGIPILNIAPPHTEVEKILSHNKCGVSFEPNDIKGIANFIHNCYNDNEYLESLKRNAFIASKKYSPTNAIEYTKSLLDS